eukprot:1153212-Prymnesium_polylepis.1
MPLCSGVQPGAPQPVPERTLLRARQTARAHASHALMCMDRVTPLRPRTLYDKACAAGMWTSAACRKRGFRAPQWPEWGRM